MKLALPCALRAPNRSSEVLLWTEVLRAGNNGPGKRPAFIPVGAQVRVMV
jgi:hypothetical protein